MKTAIMRSTLARSVIFLPVSILIVCLMIGCYQDRSSPTVKKGTAAQSSTNKIGSILDSVRRALEEGKVLLINEGKYKCCITEVCDACALAEFECYCYELLKAKEAVCFECFDGWQRGKGVDAKIKKEDVRMVRHVNACNVHAKRSW